MSSLWKSASLRPMVPDSQDARKDHDAADHQSGRCGDRGIGLAALAADERKQSERVSG